MTYRRIRAAGLFVFIAAIAAMVARITGRRAVPNV